MTSVRLVDGGSLLQGRIEVQIGGSWGTVCSTGFSKKDAQVVCRQLGLSGGEPRLTGAFGKGRLPVILASVACKGTEPGLAACPFKATQNCPSGKSAAVICASELAAAPWLPQ